MTRDPEIRLSGRRYPASYFVQILEGLTHKTKERPALLDELKAAVVDAIRRDQEHDGDSLRGAGDGGPRGKGDHSDPTLSAAMQEWDQDNVHANAVKLCEHLIEADNHIRAAHSAAVRLGAYGRRDRESTLIECANPKCEATMTGIGEDRPRRGRCMRCYKFLMRRDRDWTPSAIDDDEAA